MRVRWREGLRWHLRLLRSKVHSPRLGRKDPGAIVFFFYFRERWSRRRRRSRRGRWWWDRLFVCGIRVCRRSLLGGGRLLRERGPLTIRWLRVTLAGILRCLHPRAESCFVHRASSSWAASTTPHPLLRYFNSGLTLESLLRGGKEK